MKLIPKPLRRHAERLMAEEVGRVLYGNLLGPANNRAAARRLKAARAAAGPIADSPQAAALRQRGCGFYEAVDAGVLAEVRAQYLAAVEDAALTERTGAAPRRLARPGEPVYRVTLRDTAAAVPAALRLLDGPLQGVIRAYYGAHFRLHSVAAWRIFHVPAGVLAASSPYSLLWHVDGHPPDTLKLFVALSDISADDGPLHFLDRARTASAIRAGYRNRRRYGGAAALLEDPHHLGRLTGPPGSAAFCNTTTNLHRAGIPAPGRCRDILQFRFEPAVAPFDPAAPLTATPRAKPPAP